MASPSTPPSTDPTLEHSIQHHVYSGLPRPQSVADTRLKTLRRLLKGYSSLSAPTLLQPLSPNFTHEVLPQSLGMPVRGKEDFAHHAAMVFSAFQSFDMKPTELWEDPDRGGVILRCAMEGILKTKEKPEGEKGEGKAEEGGKVGMEAKEEVTPQVDMEDVYNPDGDLSNILGDLAESPEIPETLLSPITEVTEPGSEIPPLSSLSLSNPSTFSCHEEEQEPTSSSPPTSLEDAHPSPPSPSPPILEEPSFQSQQDKSTDKETIHWNNECLLIISFTPCGSQISKIQEFVDSAKAVEMKKKHAPKGFDEASAPPPPTYKPATYLDLDTLKLKDGGGGCPGHGHQLGMDRPVQYPMPMNGLNSLDTSDTFSTTTEYPSSNQNSPLRCLVDWSAETSGPPSTNDADAEEADCTPKWKKLRFATTKSTSPAKGPEAFNSGSGSGSGFGHVHGHNSGLWSSSGDLVDHEHGRGENKGWSGTVVDTIEVINQFVPSRLLPVELDDRTGQVAVKREWVSGAATFVAGVALGNFWFGGGRGGGRVG
ncbi:hypothetical protein NEUTE1DRAFT_50142 [Neurospora tetrasperma FGSC 2508]|uniref:Uncharacterized protein n=1 Tax=Neurospora tetrasperma (strain FGSC 2508 / ATCC MYA-4615 / P0657) TaxID=510951 RepID=F8MVJ4_NEUT8|nr:uncharacterized protein NEUTE1DRAFT_50142 [Neurospora tetrasperma FGSC 2508]EGO53946.1 hypothetical protein NEUTE1DRAFT_50142 [Neurospora tetrasperma FGSC 2508]